MMENYFLQDIGLISIILIVGFILRYQILFLQRLFIPVSIIGGVLALLLGKSGLQWIPFSENIASYPGIMIAFLFGALPFTFQIKKNRSTQFRKGTLEIGGMTLLIMLLQWGLGLLFALSLLKWIFPSLNDGFGALIAAGFFGGHGTAAAISESFSENLQWEDASSLAMTAATVGIFAATIGGVIWVQWGVRNKAASFLTSFSDLPSSLKTGLVKKEEQKSIGLSTFSNISIDPLLMHLLLVLLIGITGIYLSKISSQLTGGYTIAGFSFAFLVGILFKQIIIRFHLIDYFDHHLMNRICGVFADLIVAFGIASIKISVVIKYAAPLIILFLFGVLLAILIFRRLGPRAFTSHWFEKSTFLWGMSLGVTAIGIALLRMTDPDGKSETLPQFAIGYLAVTPFEVACLAFFPILVSQGYSWAFTITCLALSIGLYFFLSRKNGK